LPKDEDTRASGGLPEMCSGRRKGATGIDGPRPTADSPAAWSRAGSHFQEPVATWGHDYYLACGKAVGKAGAMRYRAGPARW